MYKWNEYSRQLDMQKLQLDVQKLQLDLQNSSSKNVWLFLWLRKFFSHGHPMTMASLLANYENSWSHPRLILWLWEFFSHRCLMMRIFFLKINYGWLWSQLCRWLRDFDIFFLEVIREWLWSQRWRILNSTINNFKVYQILQLKQVPFWGKQGLLKNKMIPEINLSLTLQTAFKGKTGLTVGY